MGVVEEKMKAEMNAVNRKLAGLDQKLAALEHEKAALLREEITEANKGT